MGRIYRRPVWSPRGQRRVPVNSALTPRVVTNFWELCWPLHDLRFSVWLFGWTFLERLVGGLVSCVAPRGWRKVQMAVHHLHQGAGDHRASWGRGALSLTYRSVGPRGRKLAGEMAQARVYANGTQAWAGLDSRPTI